MSSTVVSSKGQVVLPSEIRQRAKLEVGARLAVQDTPFGILLVKIPKEPLAALRGAGKGLGVMSSDVRKLRQLDNLLEAGK